MKKLSVSETKWSSLLARTRALILYISIWIFDFGPEKLPGLSRNGPQPRWPFWNVFVTGELIVFTSVCVDIPLHCITTSPSPMQCCLIAFTGPRKQITTSFGRNGGKMKVNEMKLVAAIGKWSTKWGCVYIFIVVCQYWRIGSGSLISYFRES